MMQEPSYCHMFQLVQAARRLLPLLLEVEKDQQKLEEDSARASLPELLLCQKRFFEPHLLETKEY